MISVIVPIYNVEEYLSTCIESILNQTYKDLEILLIDDGSTDNSGKICDEYAKQDHRCIVIHQLNKGEAEARNTGLDHATGEYISFIDGDDYIHPQMFEILHEALQKGDYDFSMTLYKEVHNKETSLFIPNYTFQELNQDQLIYGLYNSSRKRNNYPEISFHVVWNKLYKRSTIKSFKFIDTSSEDTVFNNSIFLTCKKSIVINQIMYYWVQRRNSITHQSINKRYINKIISFQQCLTNIPSSYPKYKGIALEKLYKSFLYVRLYSWNTPYQAQAVSLINRMHKKHKKEFIYNRYISSKYKIILLTFLQFPQLYRWYINYKNKQAIKNNHGNK